MRATIKLKRPITDLELDVDENAIVPQRMHGKWEEKNVCDDKNVIEEWQSARCSVCGKYHTTPYTYYFDDYSFCPNCGADMRGDENESD